MFVLAYGRDLLIGFRGERNAAVGAIPVIYVVGTINDTAVAVERVRQAGINYYGLETLDIRLGSGDEVVNVQGTLPHTIIDLGGGDDRVYVSHLADVGQDARPQYLRGHLDLVQGALDLAFGAGRHTLLISDEMASVGDEVRITDAPGTGEILIAGLAPAPITYGADPVTGNFHDGIRIWTGSGADTIAIDATHARESLTRWTVTWLNTGLGDDIVDVDLELGQDGFFVLDTQGGYQNRLHLAADLLLGDLPLPADAVAVHVDGVAARPVRATSSTTRSDTIGLLDALPVGATVTVTITRSTLQAAVGGVFPVLATVLPVETFTLPQIAPDSDNDTVHGEDSTLPLVIFGGQDDDDLHGGTGADVIFGDRGRVLYLDTAQPLPATDVADGAALAALVAAAATVLGHGGALDNTDGVPRGATVVLSVDPSLGGNDVIRSARATTSSSAAPAATRSTPANGINVVFGDYGRLVAGDRQAYNARLAALPLLLGIVTTLAPTLGGDDQIVTGAGKDVVLGGAGADWIRSGAGNDIVLGDHGSLAYADDRALVSGAPESRLRLVRTTDHNDGGRDRIEGGTGQDVLVGGSAGDSIDGDEGDDLIFGDQVTLERRVGDTTSARFQSLGGALLYGLTGDQLALLDGVARAYRDADQTAPDWALYRVLELFHSAAIEAAGVPAGKVQTYGDDYITGGAGDDLIFGQLGNDVLLGDGALEDRPGVRAAHPGRRRPARRAACSPRRSSA